MRPAVFLDRDNTIIHNDGDLGDPGQVELMKGAATAIASLRGLGYRIVVVTNQGGVARGHYTEEDVHTVHDRVAELVDQQANGATIDAFYYCPYHPEGTVERYTREHPSRKPSPGMLLQAAADLKLDLPVSWTIGDQLRDVEAGLAAGTRTILLQAATPAGAGREGTVVPDYVASGMVEAVRIIAQQRSPELASEPHRSRKLGEPKRKKWDAQRVAEIQTPREQSAEHGRQAESQAREGAPEFRPWSVGEPAVEKPIVPTPFRKRFFKEDEDESAVVQTPAPDRAAPTAGEEPQAREPAVAPVPNLPASSPAPAQPRAEPNAEETASTPVAGRSETDKTLRMILKELRAQRGSTGEFGYLTILAVVLQLIAIVCLLGALWRGGADVAVFARWIGVGLMAQFGVIATLMFER